MLLNVDKRILRTWLLKNLSDAKTEVCCGLAKTQSLPWYFMQWFLADDSSFHAEDTFPWLGIPTTLCQIGMYA